MLRGEARRARAAARALITFSGVLLLASCLSGAIRRSDIYRSYFDEPSPAAPAPGLSYEKRGAIHIISLSGDEHAMGVLYGEKARELGVRELYGVVFRNAARMLNDEVPPAYRGKLDVRTVKRLLLQAWDRMEPNVPRYALELLRGFAEGSGLSLNDVRAMHAIPDFTETSCSALWASGEALEGGGPLQVRVLDYIMGLGIQQSPAVVFLRFPEGRTVANIGWLGLLGVISGMNDRELAVSEMGYGNPAGETFSGIPMPFLLLDVLRFAADPEDAERIIRSRPRTNSYVYVMGTARRGALAFVASATEVLAFRPGQKDAPVEQLSDTLHAGHYEERMVSLLREAYGRVSIRWLEEQYLPRIAMSSNLQCVIYDLAGSRFFVANSPDGESRAADQSYTEVAFPPQQAP